VQAGPVLISKGMRLLQRFVSPVHPSAMTSVAHCNHLCRASLDAEFNERPRTAGICVVHHSNRTLAGCFRGVSAEIAPQAPSIRGPARGRATLNRLGARFFAPLDADLTA
jgi:hypothetical protein